jgi:hypothetical protein
MVASLGFVIYDKPSGKYLASGPYSWTEELQLAKVFVMKENAQKRVEDSFTQELRSVRIRSVIEETGNAV